MKIIPHGDYYVWFCDWCDSRNLTLWTRFDAEEVVCGACHSSLAINQEPAAERQVPAKAQTIY